MKQHKANQRKPLYAVSRCLSISRSDGRMRD